MNKCRLSGVVITYNEADKIEACLRSLFFCDEIVVVDSGSIDGTREICRAAGARVVEQAWLGYGQQKRFAVASASYDWVLCIDADERVSSVLEKSISGVMQAPAFVAYSMSRRNRFLGRWLRHGEGYPDISLRLFDRRSANWSEDTVHERVDCDFEVGRLIGDLLHESQESLASYLDKQNRYTSLQAQNIAQRCTRPPYGKVLLSPLVRFIKFYILRLGFLDGVPGFVHIVIGCMNSLVKYAKAIELVEHKEDGS